MMHNEHNKKPLTEKEINELRNQKIERTDIDFGALWKSIAWFMVFTISGIGVVGLMYKYWKPEDSTSSLPVSQKRIPKELTLQTNVTVITDINELREKENRLLNSYGWADKKKGIVRIPIQQAKDKFLDLNHTKKDYKSGANH